MRKSRFTEHQILSILAEVAAGKKINEVCAKHGLSVPTFYLWKAKYQSHLSEPSKLNIGNSGQSDAPTSLNPTLRAGKSLSEELESLRNRVADLEKENDQLRRIYIELSLDRASFKLHDHDRKTHSVA